MTPMLSEVMAQAVSFSDTNPLVGTVSGDILVTRVRTSGFQGGVLGSMVTTKASNENGVVSISESVAFRTGLMQAKYVIT